MSAKMSKFYSITPYVLKRVCTVLDYVLKNLEMTITPKKNININSINFHASAANKIHISFEVADFQDRRNFKN